MTQCHEIMKSEIECLSSSDSSEVAASRMRDLNIGFLPICDDEMRVLGTVTDRDIAIRLVAEKRPTSTTVDQIMTREVVACHPEDDIADAQELMGEHHKSRIMCVDDDGMLVGVISLSDLACLDGGSAALTLNEVSRREARAGALM